MSKPVRIEVSDQDLCDYCGCPAEPRANGARYLYYNVEGGPKGCDAYCLERAEVQAENFAHTSSGKP